MSNSTQQLEAPADRIARITERVLAYGDLASLTMEERNDYLLEVCRSLGLNPLTRPLEYIELDGKLTLYVKRDATDQLRKSNDIRTTILSREMVDGTVYVVTAQAQMPNGRTDESIGAVALVREEGQWKQNQQSGKRFFEGTGRYIPLPPEQKANAIMRAETKAKRRVTLSICGLGLPDETDVMRGDYADITDEPTGPPRQQGLGLQQQQGRLMDAGAIAGQAATNATATAAATAAEQAARNSPEAPELVQLRLNMMKMTREQREAVFQGLKSDLMTAMGDEPGKEAYYTVLRHHQVEHCSQFQTVGKANSALTDLWNLRARVLGDVADAQEPA